MIMLGLLIQAIKGATMIPLTELGHRLVRAFEEEHLSPFLSNSMIERRLQEIVDGIVERFVWGEERFE